MSQRIAPTVGRMLWFYPDQQDGERYQGLPLAAVVAAVNEDGTVNLGVFDANGCTSGRRNVLLIQGDDPSPAAGDFCKWMPYQLGQAAKTEQAETASAERLRELQKYKESVGTGEVYRSLGEGPVIEPPSDFPAVSDVSNGAKITD